MTIQLNAAGFLVTVELSQKVAKVTSGNVPRAFANSVGEAITGLGVLWLQHDYFPNDAARNEAWAKKLDAKILVKDPETKATSTTTELVIY